MYHAIVRHKLRQTFEQINAGNYEGILRQFSPDLQHWFSGSGHALAGQRDNLQITTDWYKRLARIFPDLRFELKKVVVSGWPWHTLAAVEWVDHFSSPDGQSFSNEGVHFLKLKWGRVTELHIYCDTERLARICQTLGQQGRTEALELPLTA